MSRPPSPDSHNSPSHDPGAVHIAAVLLCVCAWCADVGASCSFVSLNHAIDDQRVAVMFSGTVRDVRLWAPAQIVTFDVDRVWKGSVTKTITIYNRIARSPTDRVGGTDYAVPFEFGRRYVVLAHRLDGAEMASFSLNGDADHLGTGFCADGSRFIERAEDDGDLRDLGPGRPPR